ncbi:hypothetical protein DY023_04030 [Microbacterium bovistercoris]|uniref:Uncharacterized protein n=1 Tax=Microbacterium bovistercoris TaxID=2293570 RepID=A0A371NWJ1_9MICO|nr:hypothetical protein [Microbacterium bovistercoris]REJ07375.1 hypothetical protein DY023_04030 [Microbacterium bovistercoris]
MADVQWGEVPESVRIVIDALRANIAHHAAALEAITWPRGAHDIDDELTETLQQTEAVLQASKDLRSFLTAYAHRFHQPRPTMANVARAQNASPQAVSSRYSKSTVEGIAALREFEKAAAAGRTPINDSPQWTTLTAAIATGIPSLARAISENDTAAYLADEIDSGLLTTTDPEDPRAIASRLLAELGAVEPNDL